MTIEALKQEIEHLPEEEQTIFVAWLARKDSEARDRQMERDFSEGGAGMDLIAAWDAEVQGEQSILLENFLDRYESDAEEKR